MGKRNKKTDKQLADAKKKEAVRRLAASHEAGHALVAWFLPLILNIKYVWVGHKLTQGMPNAVCKLRDHQGTDKDYLKAKLAVLVAGPVATELIHKAGKLRSENDILEALQIAEEMICKYGYCDTLGNQQFPDYYVGGCSPKIRKKIQKETRKLLIEAINTAQDLIIKNQEKWELLVQGLMDYERTPFKKIEQIFGPRPKS